MNKALPIMLVCGDRWSASCNITGGAISKAIFSARVKLQNGYTFSGGVIKDGSQATVYTPSGSISITQDGEYIVINCTIDNLDTTIVSNNVIFYLPSELTKVLQPGNYSYNISVVEYISGEVNAQYYTPVYTNALGIFARVNGINI